ncbi:MAG TPA: menaquinone biosynthesis protein, partial [Vicinamibacterales bacterium]|nr:menaquinone biosynthesis protein [Vicinamibacterales bacterium]
SDRAGVWGGAPREMTGAPLRLGAVGYLNARPLVHGLERNPAFSLRFDVPSECARLLHERTIDVGLIPSIEFLRGGPYYIVPDLAIASNGPVASVALYTTRSVSEIRSIALDTDSRTSVALVRVLCVRHFKVSPTFNAHVPDLTAMLHAHDAALLIGDKALFSETSAVHPAGGRPVMNVQNVQKIDLGSAWKEMTGLPFVYAFWAGRVNAVPAREVRSLQEARDAGVTQAEAISRDYFPESPGPQAIAVSYLRDNIKYSLGEEELAGLREFYRYAAEVGDVAGGADLRFY